jgi:hypothetical protein
MKFTFSLLGKFICLEWSDSLKELKTMRQHCRLQRGLLRERLFDKVRFTLGKKPAVVKVISNEPRSSKNHQA